MRQQYSFHKATEYRSVYITRTLKSPLTRGGAGGAVRLCYLQLCAEKWHQGW